MNLGTLQFSETQIDLPLTHSNILHQSGTEEKMPTYGLKRKYVTNWLEIEVTINSIIIKVYSTAGN